MPKVYIPEYPRNHHHHHYLHSRTTTRCRWNLLLQDTNGTSVKDHDWRGRPGCRDATTLYTCLSICPGILSQVSLTFFPWGGNTQYGNKERGGGLPIFMFLSPVLLHRGKCAIFPPPGLSLDHFSFQSWAEDNIGGLHVLQVHPPSFGHLFSSGCQVASLFLQSKVLTSQLVPFPWPLGLA